MGVYIPYTRLPSAYQEVEWIQSSGSQYINTGVTAPTNYLKTYMKINPQTVSTGSQDYRAGGAYNGNRANVHYIGYGQGRFYAGFGGGDYDTGIGLVANTLYEVTMIANNGSYSVTVNNSTVTGTYSGSVAINRPFFLFRNNENGSAGAGGTFKIYSFQMTTSNGLVRDFVPCYRKSDSVVGMYDLVNDQFYTNAGAGTFSKGNDVNMSELKNAYIGEYRVPGANTLAYYPLTSTSTVNDMKGSGTAYNLTNNGDVTFGTYDGISCAKFGGTQNTSCLYYNSSLFTGSAEFTVSIWHKQLSTYSGYHNNILSVGTHNGTNGFIEWIRISDVHLFVGGWTNDRDTGYVMPVGVWQNIVYTHKNGTIKVYVNGALKYTGTVSFNIQNGRTILGGGIPNNSVVSVDNMQGYLSNVIFESVEWTTQEITDYYNLTKSTYGL